MIKAVIFDLDGTLVNTVGGIGNACNHVLKNHGFDLHLIDDYKEYIGNGLPTTIYRALPSHMQNEINGGTYGEHLQGTDLIHPQLEEYVNELITYYNNNPVAETKLYDGISELLDQLKTKDVMWGIHTNKTDYIAKKVVEEFFDSMDYVGLKGPNELVPRKPNPQGSLELIEIIKEKQQEITLDEVLFVGDTEVDIETAKNLGVKSVAVSWGFRKEAFLESVNPDYLIHHPSELTKIILDY